MMSYEGGGVPIVGEGEGGTLTGITFKPDI